MNDTTLAGIGHNNAPDQIDTITAAYESDRQEAENWTDGQLVENEDQMKAVDDLRGNLRQWRLALERGQKDASAPLRDVYQAELDRWKPTIADAKRIEGCLVATVDVFKRKLDEEKKAALHAAWEETNRLRREADDKARLADARNLEAQRELEAARKSALDAEKAAQTAAKDTTKGMRTFKETVVVDAVKLARYLWEHDREAQLEFQADRARKLGLDIAGVVEIRTTKRAV